MSEIKKIGIVLSSTPAYSETFFTSKIKGLQLHGFEVVIFVQEHKSEFDLCSVKEMYSVSNSSLLQLFKMFFVILSLLPHYQKVLRFIKLERQDQVSIYAILKKIYLSAHIFKQDVDWLHFGFATMALGKENLPQSIGAKSAVSFRGFDIAIYPLKNPGCYDLLWKRIDKVHTISTDLLKLAYDLGLNSSTKFQKITPAIDVKYFSNTDENKSSSCVHFLTVARLHWKKGLIATIEAMNLLKQQGLNFKYTIIGTGSDYEIERIQYLIFEFGLTENIQLLGKKNRAEVHSYYKEADIYLQYSISEGFCNAVLEAQSMGLLCIVSDAEGLPENILDGQTGWVVKKQSPKILADTINKVCQLDTVEKSKIIEKAKRRVQDEFNIEKQQQEFVHFYS